MQRHEHNGVSTMRDAGAGRVLQTFGQGMAMQISHNFLLNIKHSVGLNANTLQQVGRIIEPLTKLLKHLITLSAECKYKTVLHRKQFFFLVRIVSKLA